MMLTARQPTWPPVAPPPGRASPPTIYSSAKSMIPPQRRRAKAHPIVRMSWTTIGRGCGGMGSKKGTGQWLLKSIEPPCGTGGDPAPGGSLYQMGRGRSFVKDFGTGSPYFNNILSATLTAHVLVPRDLKHMMSVLLSPIEYIL